MLPHQSRRCCGPGSGRSHRGSSCSCSALPCTS
jgi:hypothetical protein